MQKPRPLTLTFTFSVAFPVGDGPVQPSLTSQDRLPGLGPHRELLLLSQQQTCIHPPKASQFPGQRRKLFCPHFVPLRPGFPPVVSVWTRPPATSHAIRETESALNLPPLSPHPSLAGFLSSSTCSSAHSSPLVKATLPSQGPCHPQLYLLDPPASTRPFCSP